MSSDSNQVSSTPAVYTQSHQVSHKRSCKYCHGMIVDGRQVHDECKSDFEWEQNMKLLNAHWQPAVSSDYLECV